MASRRRSLAFLGTRDLLQRNRIVPPASNTTNAATPSANIWRDTEAVGSGVRKYWDDIKSLLQARAAQTARPAPVVVVELTGRSLTATAVIATRAKDQNRPKPKATATERPKTISCPQCGHNLSFRFLAFGLKMTRLQLQQM